MSYSNRRIVARAASSDEGVEIRLTARDTHHIAPRARAPVPMSGATGHSRATGRSRARVVAPDSELRRARARAHAPCRAPGRPPRLAVDRVQHPAPPRLHRRRRASEHTLFFITGSLL